MEKKTLRFGDLGVPVVIELIETKDPSMCRFGYKVGDSWEVNMWESSDLCGCAYYNFYPFINMFQCGGEAFYKTENKDSVVRSCPDIRAGYSFLIKKVDR